MSTIGDSCARLLANKALTIGMNPVISVFLIVLKALLFVGLLFVGACSQHMWYYYDFDFS